MRHFFSLVLLLPLGCQDYLFEQKCPEVIKEQEISRAAAKPRPADILFVVDNSGSMADEQENLAVNFDAFINEIAGPDNDYRIAVVTTDQTSRGESSGLRNDRFVSEPGTGVDAWVAAVTGGCETIDIPVGCFRGDNPQTRIIDSTKLDATAQIETFRQNVRVGSCGAGQEQGLAAMVDALGTGKACNAGFLRDEANLVIVIVSDENDASGPSVNDLDNVNDFVSALKARKEPEQVRVAVIIGTDSDGRASNCSNVTGASCGSLCMTNGPADSTARACTSQNASAVCDAHEGCSGGMCRSEPRRLWDTIPESCLWCSFFKANDCCSALGGSRYVQFAQMMEAELNAVDPAFAITGCRAEPGERAACLIDSICQDSFAATLQRIARDLVITSEFTLTPPALNPDGVGVRLRGGRWGDGVELVPGDDFIATATTLTLLGDKVPGADEEIDIYYVTEKIDSTSMPRGACGIE